MANNNNNTEFYGVEDYVRKKHALWGIDALVGWWSRVSIRPEHMADHQCRLCIADTEKYYALKKAHDPQADKFELQYVNHEKDQKRLVECSRFCFWYEWFRQLRR